MAPALPVPAPPERVLVATCEQDVDRATALFEQGDPAEALSLIEPYVKPWLRTPGTCKSDSPEQSIEPPQGAAASALTKLYADICWEMVARGQQQSDFARCTEALRIVLSIAPDDLPARLCLGHCLINLADRESDEVEQMSLLQSCIDTLQAVTIPDPVPDLIRIGMLGEARCRRALLDLPVDAALLKDAEQTLREALARGAAGDSDAAWWLQTLLVVVLPGTAAEVAEARMQESMVLLRHGLEACARPDMRPRWQAALLRAQLEQIRRTQLNLASRRLRMRDLYNEYVQAMQQDSACEVLAAWIDVLCAVAAPMVGNAALERYREIDDALERLSRLDPSGRYYANTWMQMMHGRLSIENDAGKRALLEQAEAILSPHLNDTDKPLRLQASRLALEQAVLAMDDQAREAAYLRALDLARPLTAVPSVALPALGCAMKALLALNEDKERRVYDRCLRVIGPGDVESLGLLARSAYRDGDVRQAAMDLALAWQRRDKVLPEAMLDLWQAASRDWAEQAGNDEACGQNLRHLRQADVRRRR